ncbi:MAG: hypothetical protein JO112_00400, partial [Planctomycetes bacterium]|nr:hypothetical protein [Planctomycetota bacterium]
DRFLVLAADAAFSGGQLDEAERLRGRLLQLNPHHLLKPFASMEEAVRSTDVQNYIAGLRRTYPPETAENLLETARAKAREKKPPPPIGILPARGEPGRAPETVKAFKHKDAPAPEKNPTPHPEAPRHAPKPAPASSAPSPPPPPPIPATLNRSPAAAATMGPRPPAPPSPAARVSRASLPPVVPRLPVSPPANGLCTLLFFLLLVAGLLLAGFVLARPFLPPGWFH